MSWTGRLCVIAAATSAWDHAHDTVAQMGDRFLIVRFDSWHGRHAAAEQSMSNNGLEGPMRQELAAVAGRLLETLDAAKVTPLSPEDRETLYHVANLTTFARTAVERDYKLDVAEGNMPEMPTRFLKQLLQIVRGAMALGLTHAEAMQLGIRCARDSVPPLRLDILSDIFEYPESQAADIRKRLNKPPKTVQRYLDALMLNNLINVEGEDENERRYVVKTEIVPGLIAMASISHDGTHQETLAEVPF